MDEMTIRANIASARAEQLEHQNTAKTALKAAQQCIGAQRAFEIMLQQIQKDAAEKAEAEARAAEESKKAEASKLAEIKPEPEIRFAEDVEALPETPAKGKR